MGRPRKPTQLHIVTGTARNDRMNPDEPQPGIEIPSCPPGLSAGAKTEWRRISPILEDMGLLSNMDRSALAAYCETYGRWMRSLKEIQKGGEVIETPNGSLQVSPWVSIARNAEKEIRQFCSEFGMTPASRSKVSATDPAKKQTDKKDRFFA